MDLLVLVFFALLAGAYISGKVSAERNDGRWAAAAAVMAGTAALLFVFATWPLLSLVWSAVAAMGPASPSRTPLAFE